MSSSAHLWGLLKKHQDPNRTTMIGESRKDAPHACLLQDEHQLTQVVVIHLHLRIYAYRGRGANYSESFERAFQKRFNLRNPPRCRPIRHDPELGLVTVP